MNSTPEISLVIPAAGHGSRLGGGPKGLAKLNGRPFLDHVLDAFNPQIFSLTLIVRPEHIREFEHWRDTSIPNWNLTFGVLESRSAGESTIFGLDLASSAQSPDARYILAWCDQVGLTSGTVERTLSVLERCDFAVPLVKTLNPYTHFSFEQSSQGVKFNRVLRRRADHHLPSEGMADVGLFGLNDSAVRSFLAAKVAEPLAGELDFLDLIPIASASLTNAVVEATESDLAAINTPGDLLRAEESSRDWKK